MYDMYNDKNYHLYVINKFQIKKYILIIHMMT